jgi:hypothetical protein
VEWDGPEMEIEIPPKSTEQRLVLVTHDECAFYSNDATKITWLEDGEQILQKKGHGGTIMVSSFLCDCHGPLRVSPETAEKLGIPQEAYEIIRPGKNADGYWKSEDMIKQLRDKALPVFEAMHPGMQGSVQSRCFDLIC